MIPQRGKAADAIQAFFYRLLRVLPTEWASWIGSYGIRLNARLARPEIIAGARKNLRIHKPEASEADLDRMVQEFLDGVGRVAAEFAVMHRFIREGRLEMIGFDSLKAIHGTRPIIALCVHTGNWEAFSPAFQQAGIKLNSIIQPPTSAFERKVIQDMRAGFGVTTIEPTLSGIREALGILRGNGLVSMFPDEARSGKTMGPLFGRPPHEKGNLAIAAKLARKTGASLVLGHCRRIGPCHFRLVISDAFDLPEFGPDLTPEARLLADVGFLNGRIEPVVLANIPRWYFLDDDIGPIS
jgi:KDO2-lipid IV(A) lauroyltransferase